MTEVAQGRQRGTKIWVAIAVALILLAALIIPPLVSINRYKTDVARLIASSLGRPVRLSWVELRLLPRPGFVMTDLTVEEDPEYGSEPVLHANTVTAAIRLLSLWRGRLEISRISVDEASLNIVRTTEGRWNLDSLFRNAAQYQPGGAQPHSTHSLPYLEATNSRVNFKRGIEKLPFSLVSTDLSVGQEGPGDWRVTLRGQPARTDVNLDLADTGLVRLEARLRHASELRLMPILLDLEWRDAQLGQLSRLVLGSDPGWRGELTGDLHLEGTAVTAKVTSRLRAAGVHRAEFAPAEPLDFDANCGFVYHYSDRNVENLVCDSPLGDGRIRVEGSLPGNAEPKLSVELQRVPAQAVLDALRTVRSGLGAGLDAGGTISGKFAYDPTVQPAPPKPAGAAQRRALRNRAAKDNRTPQGPLSGSVEVDGLRLNGNTLRQPIQIPKIIMQPAPASDGLPQALVATMAIPAGAPAPLAATLHLALNGYQFAVHGPGTLPRIRELARAANLPDASALDAIAGDPATLDFSAAGPWLPAPALTSSGMPAANVPAISSRPAASGSDSISGTVTLRNANWKSDALATPVQISQATLYFGGGMLRWDSVAFSYGPVKGTATLELPVSCEAPDECPPRLDIQFPSLDASELQAALLGARKEGTLLSSVIARLRPSSLPTWPNFDGTIRADALVLGPVTLHNAEADLHVEPVKAEITNLNADALGGQVHATGTVTNAEKPAYSIEAQFQKLSPVAVCHLLATQCTGGSFDGKGKIDLAGFTSKDLSSSAKGTVHFDWQRGTIPVRAGATSAPPALARFDHWSADADIANGAVTLNQNQVQQGSRNSSVEAAVTFGDPPKLTFGPPKPVTISER
jgi:hypothetical protein